MYFPLSTDTLVTFKLIENNLNIKALKAVGFMTRF